MKNSTQLVPNPLANQVSILSFFKTAVLFFSLVCMGSYAQAQCYVSLPTLSANGACIEADQAPTSSYGAVEYLWAKRVGNYIYAVTGWSTSTSLSYCPETSGLYRMCARRVGCSRMYESSDVYIDISATVGDFVFEDDNYNGIQDTGEAGVEGVIVELYRVGETDPIATDTTDEFGAYLFENVTPNESYYLTFSNLPAGFEFTDAGEGEDEFMDSDVDPTTGLTTTFTPAPGANLEDIDAGIVDPTSFPVEWLGFDAVLTNAEAHLTWSTATELNASHYEVERSIDGFLFERIGSVAAAGNSHVVQEYDFTDLQAADAGSKMISYRLKQVDLDGSFSYSSLVEIQMNDVAHFSLDVFPNPVATQLNIDWTSASTPEVVRVLNNLGQVVYQANLQMEGISQHIELNVESWTPGTYYLQMENETQMISEKIIVR